MVIRSRFTTGSLSRCLLWFLLWFLAIAVGLAPASPQLPGGNVDLSNYPWIFLREGELPELTEDLIELIIVGDVMLGRGLGNRADLFERVSSWTASADLFVGNLESVIGVSEGISVLDANEAVSGSFGGVANRLPLENPLEMLLRQPLYLIAPPGSVAILQTAGFDVLGMANNHALDGGAEYLKESSLKLRRAGIDVVGAGPGLDKASWPIIRRINGIAIAILAFTATPPLSEDSELEWKVAIWDRERVIDAIRHAHSQSDFVIVLMHWGDEYIPRESAWQREIAEDLVQAGADLIVGHHPHTVQGSELFGKPAFLQDSVDRVRLVAYSLGNFVFDQYSPEALPGVALRVFLDSQGLRAVQALPVASAPKPILIPAENVSKILERLLPEPVRVMFSCAYQGCVVVQQLSSESNPINSAIAIPWSGQIDLTGDGKPESIRRQDNGLLILQGNSEVWKSPIDWNIVDFALGDPNDDGREEVVLALHKPDPSGVVKSHPFILGFRGGMYRLMWGGSAVAQPIREVEIGDVDGDGVQELVVIEDQKDGKQTLGVWRWHGWGFSLVWRSRPALFQDLKLVLSNGRLLLEVGVVER